MGDIYGTIQVALQIINPLVSGEVALLSGLKDDVNAIKNELQTISVVLKNAEERAEGNDTSKNWVKQVRMLAYGIEDAIDRYQLFLRKNGFRKVKDIISLDVRNLASVIKGLRITATDIARNREAYGFITNHDDNVSENGRRNNNNSSNQGVLTTSLFHCTINLSYEVVEDDIAKGDVVKLLGLRNDGSPSTIAVVGMRGLGKTTVVSSVYYDKTVRSKFACRAWISMSKVKQDKDILKSMVVQFSKRRYDDVEYMDTRSLIELLEGYLEGKRYMLVFDDVGEAYMELATHIKRVLHSNNQKSQILMSTRFENVAHAWLDGFLDGVYKLKPLPWEKAWELFCKKTFQSYDGGCPLALEDLARGIVISIGRFLATKAGDTNEWSKVRQSLGFYLATNRQLSGIHKTFMQSYYDLPSYLKPCFLYFGMFPKRYPINRTRLIRLWIAEGFISESRDNLTLEEVAEEYMSELINMSMIEVKSRDPSGKVRTLGVISKFLYEMILSKLDELSFCKLLFKKDSCGNGTSRRLSIHKNYNSNCPEFLNSVRQSESSIRSLFVIDVGSEIMAKVFTKGFLKTTILLKVLDLFNAPITVIPKEVGKLLNLHYLSLRGTQVSTLPRFIGKLENLQTLDLKETSISELPEELIHLHKLRHLLGYCYEYDISFGPHCMKTYGMKIPEGLLGKCLQLQKLAFLDVNVGHKNWGTELRNLTQLRKLGLIGLKSNEGEALCYVIDTMKYLQALNVISRNKCDIIDLEHVNSPPRLLKRLYLSGPLKAFPTWIQNLHGLVKIRLRWSNLQTNPLETLQWLPNLVELQFLEAYIGEHMKIASNGFKKLKILHFLDLHSLKSLFIARGALPILEEMSIGESRNLQIPSGIKYMLTLTKLNFFNMPSSFTDRILPGQQYYSIVEHVTNVFFHNKDSNGCWRMYTLT